MHKYGAFLDSLGFHRGPSAASPWANVACSEETPMLAEFLACWVT